MGRNSKQSVRRRAAKVQHEREKGFNMDFRNDKLPEYNALRDTHLKHFFENRSVQTHLYESGLIDANGRVIDTEKNKSKLFIIEQEFKNAEKAEYWRKKEEEEMRRRVRLKRQETIELARRAERLRKIKEDREIQKQIVNATQSLYEVSVKKTAKKKKRKSKKKQKQAEGTSQEQDASFFTTQMDTETQHQEYAGDQLPLRNQELEDEEFNLEAAMAGESNYSGYYYTFGFNLNDILHRRNSCDRHGRKSLGRLNHDNCFHPLYTHGLMKS